MSEDKNIAQQLQEIFDANFDLSHTTTRMPATITTDGNSVTTFDVDDDFILNNPTAGSVKTFVNYNTELKKSAIQRTMLGYVSASVMVKNKTNALQTLVLYLNSALIELTKVLGSSIVTDSGNKISVSFIDKENFAAIEMRVILMVNNKE